MLIIVQNGLLMKITLKKDSSITIHRWKNCTKTSGKPSIEKKRDNKKSEYILLQMKILLINQYI